METPEKFDDIMRSKFAEREIPFDEANWENIKKMTDAAREKKKRRRWGIIFLIGLVSGIGISIPFIMNNTGSKNVIAENKIKQVEAKEINEVKQTQITNEKQEEKNNAVAPPENSNTEKTAEAIPTENKTVESKKEINSIEKKSNPIVSVEKRETENKTLRQAQGDVVANNPKGNSVKTILEKSTVAKKEKPEPIVSNSIVKEEKTKSVAKNENKNENSNSGNNSDAIKKETEIVVTSPTEKKEENKTQEISTEKNNVVASNENQSSAKDTSTSQSNTVKENVNPVSDTAKKTVTPIVAAAKDSAQKKNDTTAKANTWALSVVGGVNFLHFCTPIGGIEITKSFGKRWKIGSGLYYTYLIPTTDNHISRRFSTPNYDFGSSSNVTEIDVNKLHYAMLNIFTEFNINKKNSLGVGTNLFYLFTTSNSIITYNQNNNTGNWSEQKIQKTNGYSTGLSPYDIGIMAGYRRKLFGKLDAGFFVNRGLISITNKIFIGNDGNTKLPFTLYNYYSLQIVLKYNLFKK